MSMTFTKLFSSITESTVWCEPSSTRIVWITMLAMADHAGRVWASIPGLANRARVSMDEVEQALTTFYAPDPYSRTPDNEGRRIESIDGGWRLLNHGKYRAIRDEESIKESKRRHINAKREAERKALSDVSSVDTCRHESNTVDRGRHNAEAEAEAVKEQEHSPSDLSPADAGDPKRLAKENVPYQRIADSYNAACGDLFPQVVRLTDKRRKAIRARWLADSNHGNPDKQTGNVEYWQRYFTYCRSLDFFQKAAKGQTSGQHAGWVPDFDFLMTEKCWVKVCEGTYQ